MSDDFVVFHPSKEHLERFEKIIAKSNLTNGLEDTMKICASMLTAVQAHMIAAFGREEAQRILKEFTDNVFKVTRPQ